MTILTNSWFSIVAFLSGCGLGFGVGIWWVHSRRVVMDRNTHQSILKALQIRTDMIDRRWNQVTEGRKAPDEDPTSDHFVPTESRLRICVPDQVCLHL